MRQSARSGRMSVSSRIATKVVGKAPQPRVSSLTYSRRAEGEGPACLGTVCDGGLQVPNPSGERRGLPS